MKFDPTDEREHQDLSKLAKRDIVTVTAAVAVVVDVAVAVVVAVAATQPKGWEPSTARLDGHSAEGHLGVTDLLLIWLKFLVKLIPRRTE